MWCQTSTSRTWLVEVSKKLKKLLFWGLNQFFCNISHKKLSFFAWNLYTNWNITLGLVSNDRYSNHRLSLDAKLKKIGTLNKFLMDLSQSFSQFGTSNMKKSTKFYFNAKNHKILEQNCNLQLVFFDLRPIPWC